MSVIVVKLDVDAFGAVRRETQLCVLERNVALRELKSHLLA